MKVFQRLWTNLKSTAHAAWEVPVNGMSKANTERAKAAKGSVIPHGDHFEAMLAHADKHSLDEPKDIFSQIFFPFQQMFLSKADLELAHEHEKAKIKSDIDAEVVHKIGGFLGFGGKEVKTEADIHELASLNVRGAARGHFWNGVLSTADLLGSILGIGSSVGGLLFSDQKGASLTNLIANSTQIGVQYLSRGNAQVQVAARIFMQFAFPFIGNMLCSCDKPSQGKMTPEMYQQLMAQQQMMLQMQSQGGNGLTTQQQMAYA
jgi:hypothetical protein